MLLNTLEDRITEQRNTLRTDRLDMSFGELMSMFEDETLIITPEYQRVFRWDVFQQTRFIESVLLGIPIPPIFVAEDRNGTWELVDGLQRMSTILAFFGLLTNLPDKNNTTLSAGELVNELDKITVNDLPIKLKTTIKRAVCRVEIVRWDSNEDIRYELFNRLNTGASPLSEQEIRNCIFRSYPIDLNQVLRDLSKDENFISLIMPSERKREAMFMEELALRYFAFKYLNSEFKTTVPNYLTEFMRSVSRGNVPFDLHKEKKLFLEFVAFLQLRFGKDLFRPKGNFALHIFDSLAYALPKAFDSIQGNEESIVAAIQKLREDNEYNEIGTSTFSNMRIKKRMEKALEIFRGA